MRATEVRVTEAQLEELRNQSKRAPEAVFDGITQSAFAKDIGVTNARLSEIIHGKRPVTMDSALRFERALGFSAESWMRMQMTVDMYDALHGRVSKAVGRIKPIARASQRRNQSLSESPCQ